jgi:FMN-dependent oxidoreductase (nitrilotriacetate monooxygenase family)
MSTLDHLTKGRVGWNVVTSYLDSGARNLGQVAQMNHSNRYDVADEYLEVCYKLWEGSWEDDAVIRDVERGIYTDPSKVHAIEHDGEYFKVPGIHLSEPSPQRSPLIFQAGASSRGKQFAAENAEAIFVLSPTKAQLKNTVAGIREKLVEAGRGPNDALIYEMMTVIVDETSEKAQAKYDEFRRLGSEEGALTLMSGWMGIDLSTYSLDDELGDVDSNAMKSVVEAFSAVNNDGRPWTIRDIARHGMIGGEGPTIVGSPSEVADELQAWIEETDVDGFNLAYAITPGTFEDLVEHLVPELQRRGAYPTGPEPGTLRDRLFGKGDRLPEAHRGARYRVAATAGA